MTLDEAGKRVHFAWLRAKWNRVADDLLRQEVRANCQCGLMVFAMDDGPCDYCARQRRREEQE